MRGSTFFHFLCGVVLAISFQAFADTAVPSETPAATSAPGETESGIAQFQIYPTENPSDPDFSKRTITIPMKSGPQTLHRTCKDVPWTVPAGVTKIQVDAQGGYGGGGGGCNTDGGDGGTPKDKAVTTTVTPGAIVTVTLCYGLSGGDGGQYGGGGGGAGGLVRIFIGSTKVDASPGGGGGAGGGGANGGNPNHSGQGGDAGWSCWGGGGAAGGTPTAKITW
jgi:hypothetical protein